MTDSGYNQFCPVAMAAEILGSRWTLVVPRMSPALLSKRLKDLEATGIASPQLIKSGRSRNELTKKS